ncbi:uncharacterized protein ARMOST_20476 [Armillaria ostoyae]|uniref:Uncharacterized protein n=1 Tax=Armillaria ostoyae TaxID=47428 RepID=A0A284S7F6_ARMOS|nr:uncharacterized protein ARMOST_20476 [Armillaria ostoyae]
MHDHEQSLNSESLQTPYSPSHWQRETVPTWTAPPEDFDIFNYDRETFGGYPPPEHFSYAPFPLLNSLGWEYFHPTPHHNRCIQGYHPHQYGIYPMGGANDAPIDQEEGGSNDPPTLTREEHLQQVKHRTVPYLSAPALVPAGLVSLSIVPVTPTPTRVLQDPGPTGTGYGSSMGPCSR